MNRFSMFRLAALIVVSGALAAGPASACSNMPFMVHVGLAEQALKSKEVPAEVRTKVAEWLQKARKGDGPMWMGERQKNLNLALEALEMSPASRGPDKEMTPEQQKAWLVAEAKDMPARIAEAVSALKPDAAAMREVDLFLKDVNAAIASGAYKKAVDSGNSALIAAGVVFPRC